MATSVPPSSRIAAVLVGALALACSPADAPHCGGDAVHPDVLVVVLDTVRADHTSTYGYPRPTTIQMDALAKAGVVFEDASAPAPWTYPSHASLFTGEPPWVHGAHMIRPRGVPAAKVDDEDGVPVSFMRRDLPTLAERFVAAGYRAEAVVANSWLDPELGVTRGFQQVEYHDLGRPLLLFVNLLIAHSPYWEGPGEWKLPDRAFLDPRTAPPWVRPYLGWNNRPGVHLSYTPPGQKHNGLVRYLLGDLRIPAEDMAKLEQLYDAGVRAADFGFGRILERWLARHPDGVVALTSDHGEGFGEHGMLEHRSSVYPEVLHVPMVLAAPGCLPAGVRVREPVMLQDLYPTLLDLAGIEAAPGSLRPVVDGAPRGRPIAAAAWPADSWARAVGGRFERRWQLYRVGDEALVWSDAGDAELYDLAMDPGMRRDVAAAHPERVAVLRQRAETLVATNAAPEPKGKPLVISHQTRSRLENLGYIQPDADDR
jgi:arylsulfatase A-like enzyme